MHTLEIYVAMSQISLTVTITVIDRTCVQRHGSGILRKIHRKMRHRRFLSRGHYSIMSNSIARKVCTWTKGIACRRQARFTRLFCNYNLNEIALLHTLRHFLSRGHVARTRNTFGEFISRFITRTAPIVGSREDVLAAVSDIRATSEVEFDICEDIFP